MSYRRNVELLELLRMEYRRGCDNALLPRGMKSVCDEYGPTTSTYIKDLLAGYEGLSTIEERQAALTAAGTALKREIDVSYGGLTPMSPRRKATLAKWCIARHDLANKQREYEQKPKMQESERVEYTLPDGTPAIGYGRVSLDAAYVRKEQMDQALRIVNGLRLRLNNDP